MGINKTPEETDSTTVLHVSSPGETSLRLESTGVNDANLRFCSDGVRRFAMYYDASNDSLRIFDNVQGSTRFRINQDGSIIVASTIEGRDIAVDGTKLDGIAPSANNYSLPKATTTIRGGVELGSDTVQTVAANGVSATAGKTYAVQLNSADQMVVNVPWSDSTNPGTVTSIATGVGIAGGTITSSGTISLDFAELTDMTADISGSTQFILQNGTTESRKAASEIKLSALNNDSGWTNTAAPAITSNGSTPALASGITATEVRDLIVAPAKTGTGASGTWAIGITGTAGNSTTSQVSADSAGNRALVLCTADGTSRNETLYKDAGTTAYYNTSNDTLVVPTISAATINSSGNITAYSSDSRLKLNQMPIDGALNKVMSIGGYTFDWDIDKCSSLDFKPANIHEHGVIAQEIETVVPDAVCDAPFDRDLDGNSISGDFYKTVRYDRLVPLLIEAIKELKAEVDTLKAAK
jgi:hypothetical protein